MPIYESSSESISIEIILTVIALTILKASKNATVTLWPYPRFNAVEALLSNKSVTLWL